MDAHVTTGVDKKTQTWTQFQNGHEFATTASKIGNEKEMSYLMNTRSSITLKNEILF